MAKILPTIGPATENSSNLKQVLKFSSFIRLNGSHNSISWHSQISKKIKKIKPDTAILLDLPGMKPRTNNKFELNILKNERVNFFFKKKVIKDRFVKSIELTRPIPELKGKLNFFSVSDGKYLFKIIKIGKHNILGKSLSNFILRPKQGVNIPNSIYNEKKQIEIYFNFINKVKKKVYFDSIGLSFIQNDEILKILRKKLPNINLISKIENTEGLKNMEKICLNSDAVMIDRGDLSAEIGENNLFEATDKIISFCKKNGIPTILATENLDSMLINQTPSKSEIMSLAYFVSKKIDRIMLSDETATSKNWKNILIWLKTFLAKNINKKIIQEKDDFSIWQLLKNFSTLPIILFTKKGYAINNLLKLENTYTPIIFTDNKKIYNLNNLREKVISLLTQKFKKKGISSFINKNIIKNLKLIFSEKNKAILVYIADPKTNSRVHTIQLISREDYKI